MTSKFVFNTYNIYCSNVEKFGGDGMTGLILNIKLKPKQSIFIRCENQRFSPKFGGNTVNEDEALKNFPQAKF